MRKTSLFLNLLIALTAFAGASIGMAGELDHEESIRNVEKRAHAADLPGTVVIRVNQLDGSIAILETADILSTSENAKNRVLSQDFTAVSTQETRVGAPKSELDRDSSTSSWYFYFNDFNWSAPTYSYYGYSYYYQPYYFYSYSYYYYYYYRWY